MKHNEMLHPTPRNAMSPPVFPQGLSARAGSDVVYTIPQQKTYSAPSLNVPFINDPAMQFGAHAFSAGQDYVNTNITKYFDLPHLKYYFDISQIYVFQKIKRLFFPFRVRNWDRLTMRDQLHEYYRPPRDDVNAPDLYIPLMGFVTYVLIAAVDNALKQNGFQPEHLGASATKCLFIMIVEILMVKFGCYIFSVQSAIPVLDLVSYSGYKFMAIIASTLASRTEFYYCYWVCLVYTMIALSLFWLRSMRYIIIPEALTASSHRPQWRRRINFLVGVVGLQVLFSWLLVIR